MGLAFRGVSIQARHPFHSLAFHPEMRDQSAGCCLARATPKAQSRAKHGAVFLQGTSQRQSSYCAQC